MSYKNFMATIWSEHILHDLGKFTVFKDTCDYQFEGEAKRGESVKILGVGRPTIRKYIPNQDIAGPERPTDSSVFLTIDQYDYFNYGVDDVDKAQSKKGVMEALATETTRSLAEELDKFIATKCAKEAGHKIASTQITTEAAAKKVIDDAFVKLWDTGVSQKDSVDIFITPWFYNLFKNQLITIKTDNDNAIKTGSIGMYNNAHIKMSNNLYKDATDDHIIIKTRKGMAVATGIEETEAYRPQGRFEDAIKGLHTYGAKAVRPKEIVCIKAHQ